MHPRHLIAAALAAALALPAAAGEHIFLLRTQEDPSVFASCPEGDTIRLGALLYTPRSRASDGLVLKDASAPIGTAIGCGKLLTTSDPKVANPFSMQFNLPEGTFTARGYCSIASATFPIPGYPAPLFLVGCSLDVDASAEMGVLNGIASSASVFTPKPLPGYGTGSFWTLQVYLDEGSDSLPR